MTSRLILLALLSTASCTSAKPQGAGSPVEPISVYVFFYVGAGEHSVSEEFVVEEGAPGEFSVEGSPVPENVVRDLLAAADGVSEKLVARAEGSWPASLGDDWVVDVAIAIQDYGIHVEHCDQDERVTHGARVDIKIAVMRNSKQVLISSESNCTNFAPWHVLRNDGLYVDRVGLIEESLTQLLQAVRGQAEHVY